MKSISTLIAFLCSLLIAQTAFSQNISETFDSQTDFNNLGSNCWRFTNVAFTSTSPITGTGSIVNSDSGEFVTPLLTMPSDGKLKISFNYNLVSAQTSGVLKLQVIVLNGTQEGKPVDVNISNGTSANITITNNPNTPVTGTEKVIFRFSKNGIVQIDNLTINAPITNPGGCVLQAPVPLPVKLIDFSGATNKGRIALKWSIAENETAQRFEVQRSTNGVDYSLAGLVFTSENKGNENYAFTEINALPKVMYRLKMFDKNNRAEFSKTIVISAESTATGGIKVTTTPAKDKLIISFQNAANEQVQMNIYDNVGRMMQQEKLQAYSGTNSQTIALRNNFKAGLYIVELVTSTTRSAAKFQSAN